MAIKMDGNTITELQLKASDGSQVTKQLTEDGTIPTPTETLDIISNGRHDVTNYAKVNVSVEGGGGTPGEFVLLKTVTQSEATHKIDFVWETAWNIYDAFLIVCNATLSASDYLYFGFNPSSTQNCVYHKSAAASEFNGLDDFTVFYGANNRNGNKLAMSGSSGGKFLNGYTSGGTASFFAYNADTNIQTGSTFRVYGAKLPTA